MARKALVQAEKQDTESDLPPRVDACLEAKKKLRKACKELTVKGLTPVTSKAYHEVSNHHKALFDALSNEEQCLVNRLFREMR